MNREDFSKIMKEQLFFNLGDLVYKYIYSQITDYNFKPGERIKVSQIAEDLGISRTPVRAAFDRLLERELIERACGGSAFYVAPMRRSELIALFDARSMIESFAVHICCFMIKPQELKWLEALIEESRESLERGDRRRFTEMDISFHEAIITITGNHLIIDMHKRLKMPIQRYMRAIECQRTDTWERDTSYAISTHTAIYRAIKDKYSVVAESLMKEHIMNDSRTAFMLK